MWIKRITYQDYLANGKAQGIHTVDAPAISQAEWNELYNGDVILPGPAIDVLPKAWEGRYEKVEDAKGKKLCEDCEARMEAIA